jgi:hypothetical protein
MGGKTQDQMDYRMADRKETQFSRSEKEGFEGVEQGMSCWEF